VRLRDIADVTFGFKEPESFAREFGKSVVMLDVIKRAGENLLDASDKINAIIKEDHGTVLPARTSPSPSPATRAIRRA
jgi:multidrug efflux pump